MRCPYCAGHERWKWNNPTWMFLTPGSMTYWRCSECGREFVAWFGFIPLRTRRARLLARIWHWALLIALLVVSSFLIPLLIRG